jgi:hypothetical protein
VQGARYAFKETVSIGAGAVTNAMCVGRRIDVHRDEPSDDLSQPYRVLEYPPLAVWVQPTEAPTPLGDACGSYGPRDCIPMRPHAYKILDVKFPNGDVPKVGGEPVREWTGYTHRMRLCDGFAVTDYSAQGQSFGDAVWFAHLGVPPDGQLSRASVLVTLTRFRDWGAVMPWAPLWPEGDEQRREYVIRRFCRAARPSRQLRRELRRQEHAARRSRVLLRQQTRDVLTEE